MTAAMKNGAFPHDARTAAELYLKKGLAPIPLPLRSKGQGLAEGWQHLRLTLDTLDEQFPSQQARNVGLLLGQPSDGLIDLDLDAPEAVAAGPLLLPATGWVSGRSGKPRSHWWYVVDDPPHKAQEKFTDLDGADLLELRSTGGQTIVPPSVHESGQQVIWHSFTEPAQVDLRDLFVAARSLAAVALLARHWPAKGTRQDAFLALAGGLLRAGWARDRAARFVEALTAATRDEEPGKRVQTVAQTAGKLEQDRTVTGWPKLEAHLGFTGKEVVRLARQWLGMMPTPLPPPPQVTPATKAVRKPEPYRPFPVEALPAPVGEYVRQGALALGCDPAYLALPALAVVASVIGNARAIRLKGGWHEPSVVWSAIVGDSGTLKSPAYLKAVSHLFRLQKRLLNEFRQEAAAYQEQREEHQVAKRKAKKESAEPGDPPERPVLRRVVCSDTTIEKLAEILEDAPRGLLVARDELAGWLGSFTRYKAQKGASDLPNWLETHRAGTLIVDRKTGDRRTLFVQNAAVSVTGGIQPGVLARALTPEFLDAGLAARLLMAMPPKLPKSWTEAEVAPEVERAHHGLLDALLALDLDERDGEKVPHALTLSRDGKAAWVAFYNDWAAEQAAVEGEMAAAFSKLEAYAARFALLHHVVERVARGEDDRGPIGRESVEAGVTLCRWFACEARRIYATLSESDEQRDGRRLVEFVHARGGTITVRELMRANCRRYPDAAAAESALAALAGSGLARWVEVPTTMQGGRPTRAVELCMTHDTDDTDPGGEDDSGPDAHDNGDDSGPDGDTPQPPTSQNPPENGENDEDSRSGVIGVMRHAGYSTGRNGDTAKGSSDPAVMRLQPVGTAPLSRAHLLVKDAAGLGMVANALGETALVGLDVETTGLDPRADRARLLSVACDTIDGGTFCYLVDCFAVDPSPLWEALAERELVLHNAAFDLAFLARMGFTPAGKVRDTMLLAHLLTAGTGGRVGLAACCQRWLGLDLDKAEQKSDWSGPLSESQLAYAAADVAVLVPLLRALTAEVKGADLIEAARVEHRCLPAVVWMAREGVAIDQGAWRALAVAAQDEAGRLREELHRAGPHKPVELFHGWNWDSTQQAQQALALAGCVVEDTSDETLAALDHPLARLLRRYRLARKRCGTYGIDWLKHVAADGRVYSGWKQCGAVTGRMAVGDPNLQNIPRGKDYRRCFAAPPGRVLIKADYSQIELRIAAKIAGEARMLEAYRRGDDLHAMTARSMTGKPEVSAEERQMAKPVNFGMIYGLGAKSLSSKARAEYGLDLSEADAARYRAAFFRAYPGVARWHDAIRRANATETRTLTGRRVLVEADKFYGGKANYAVQGTGGDGIKVALALLWERRGEAPGAFPVMAIHDEIVVEADAGRADAVAGWLRRAMLDAMAPLIDPVPVEVEVKVGTTWGGG